MSSESINLCVQRGFEVSDLLVRRIQDSELPLSVGQLVLGRMRHVSPEAIIDGHAMATFATEKGDFTFQFEPNERYFAETAIDLDGQPICLDCLE
jgi:hypothetical protein